MKTSNCQPKTLKTLKYQDSEIPSEKESEVSIEVIREELLGLSEKGKINYAPKYIQKANRDTLEKIKRKYNRKQLEITNECISNIVISKLADTLEHFEMIDNSSELGQELSENQMFKEEVKNLVGELMPHIPRVGLLCGGLIVGKHVINKRRRARDNEQNETSEPSNETNRPSNEMNEPPGVNLDF